MYICTRMSDAARTRALRLMAEAAERGERCPVAVCPHAGEAEQCDIHVAAD